MRSMWIFAILGVAATVSASAADEPAWLTEARAREAKPVAIQSIASQDGAFSVKVPAKLKEPIDPSEGTYAMALDFGAGVEANCEVVPDGLDLAAVLRNAATLTFERLEPVQGKIEARAIEHTDAGAIGGSPYLAIEWVYRVATDKGPMLGTVKQVAATKYGHGVYCSHVEMGYRKSFRAMVDALVGSLETKETPETPYLTDITALSLATSAVGISYSTLTRDKDGDIRAYTSTALMIPNGPGTLMTQDSTHLHWTRPDGSLINAVHAQSTNGDLDVDLTLARNEQNRWAVEGTFKGKALNAVIAGDRDPGTPVSQLMLRKSALAVPDAIGQERAELMWLAQNPTEFSDWRIKVTGKSDGNQFAVQEMVAGLTADTIVSAASGLPVSGTMSFGPQTLTLRSVYTDGRP